MTSPSRLPLMMFGFLASQACGADFERRMMTTAPAPDSRTISSIKGRAAALSGDALWFAIPGIKVRLAGIRSCALPQWAFDPSKEGNAQLTPIPCGSFAMAWLKRSVGKAVVSCRMEPFVTVGGMSGRCEAHGRDLAYEMLRVGWARVDGAGTLDLRYLAAERYARAARYGLWGAYVLDPDEWNLRAVDQTAHRRPSADQNLLLDRHSEMTPPFSDWRNSPTRKDR
jgi:endonuclease YncB( thermonuclease family)